MHLIALAAKVEDVYTKLLVGEKYQQRRNQVLELFKQSIKCSVTNKAISMLLDVERKYYNKNAISVTQDEIYPEIFDDYISILNDEKNCRRYDIKFEQTIIYNKLLETYEIIAISYLNKIDENGLQFLRRYLDFSPECSASIVNNDEEFLIFLFMFSMVLVHKTAHDCHYSNLKLTELFGAKLEVFNSLEIIFLKAIGLINTLDYQYADIDDTLLESMTEDSITYESGLVPKTLVKNSSDKDYSSTNLNELAAAKSFFLTIKDEIAYNPTQSFLSDNDKVILNEISHIIEDRDLTISKCSDRSQIVNTHGVIIKTYNTKYERFLDSVLERGQTCLNDVRAINLYNCELGLSYEIFNGGGKLSEEENKLLIKLNTLIDNRNVILKNKPRSERNIHQQFCDKYRKYFLECFEWIKRKKSALFPELQDAIEYCETQVKISMNYIASHASADMCVSHNQAIYHPDSAVKHIVNAQKQADKITTKSNTIFNTDMSTSKNLKRSSPYVFNAGAASSSSASAIYPSRSKSSITTEENSTSKTIAHSTASNFHMSYLKRLFTPNILSTNVYNEQSQKLSSAATHAVTAALSTSENSLTPSGDFQSQKTKRLEVPNFRPSLKKPY